MTGILKFRVRDLPGTGAQGGGLVVWPGAQWFRVSNFLVVYRGIPEFLTDSDEACMSQDSDS